MLVLFCVCRNVTLLTCIVAKWCVLEHQLLLTACRKSTGANMNDLDLCLKVVLRSCQVLTI